MMLEERHVINHCHRETIPVVERGTGPLGPKVLEILHSPRICERTEHLRGGVVDIVTEGVSADELETVAEPPVHLCCESVVGGSSHRHKAYDVGLKARIK